MSAQAGTKSWAPEFVAALKEAGYDFFTTVPCSLLKGAISILENEPEGTYVCAVREDAACGFACGAWLGGRKPVVLCQHERPIGAEAGIDSTHPRRDVISCSSVMAANSSARTLSVVIPVYISTVPLQIASMIGFVFTIIALGFRTTAVEHWYHLWLNAEENA